MHISINHNYNINFIIYIPLQIILSMIALHKKIKKQHLRIALLKKKR